MDVNITVSTDRPLGSRPSRRLRTEGKVPAVVYGLGEDAVPVTVEWAELRRALTTDAGLNALITLDIDGAQQLSIIKDLQRDPVRRKRCHRPRHGSGRQDAVRRRPTRTRPRAGPLAAA